MNEFNIKALNQITDKVLKAKYIPKNKTKKNCDRVEVLGKTDRASPDNSQDN
jgi:hypothetical protein